jgi:acetyl esterase/lipase
VIRAFLILIAASAFAQESVEQVYKTTGTRDLKLYSFEPATNTGPTVIFLHGGGWRAGNPQMLFPHCRFFAERGSPAVAVEYRLLTTNSVTLADCVADVKAAVRWVQKQTGPRDIVLAGESAGGHLAAAAVMTPDPVTVAAVALFNPVLDLPGLPWSAKLPGARELSPSELVRAGLPPMLIIHGTADTVVPFAQATRFTEAMQRAGNVCELIALPEEKHAFLIPGDSPEVTWRGALERMRQFLSRRAPSP